MTEGKDSRQPDFTVKRYGHGHYWIQIERLAKVIQEIAEEHQYGKIEKLAKEIIRRVQW